MNSVNVPQHVFISYSRINSDFVQQLSNDLRKEGINVWIDDKGLTPGTLDWESAIRDAIDASYAILLVATPDSRQSVHVKGELNIAQARGIPIYPIWAAENTWIDCIPLSMSNTQYIDCRPSHYSASLVTVIDKLKSIAERVIPKHYLLEPLTKIVDSYGYKRHEKVPIPFGYVCIELPSNGLTIATAGVVMKVSAYSSFLSLLDDLYTHYLHEHFKPFTYGRDWLLARQLNWTAGAIFAVPFSWLKFSDKRQYKLDQNWAMSNPPEAVGLMPNSRWVIKDTPVGNVKGIVVNDKRLFWVILKEPKAELYLLDSRCLEKTTIDAVNPDEYKYVAVANWRSFRRESAKSVVFRQTTVPLDENMMEYWAGYRSEIEDW